MTTTNKSNLKYYPVYKCDIGDEVIDAQQCPICDGTGYRPLFLQNKKNKLDSDCPGCDRMGFVESGYFEPYVRRMTEIINSKKIKKH